MVENMLINMAQTGRLGPKLNEEQLKQILLQVSSGTQKSTTVKFDRRRAAIDSDEDSL
uniref:Programmed cell death n=5 Tax=Schistosoma TaxID=6181 RepID=A0A146MGN5_SCHMA